MRTSRNLLDDRGLADGRRVQAVTDVRRERVATLLAQGGISMKSVWSRELYVDGVSPTVSVKRELNEPSDVQPTAMQVSATDIPSRKKALHARCVAS